MRIVLDLQGAQASNRARGIGRYTSALARGIARQAGRHEVLLALNGALQEGTEHLRAEFATLVPERNIRVWRGLHAVSGHDASNAWRRQACERLREAFLASLKPDVVHIGSLFEGFGDDAVTGVGTFTSTLATSVTLYDVIPLIHRETYLRSPAAESWYENKLDHLRRADLLLAISEASRRDAIRLLGLPEEAVVTIPGAASDRFRPVDLSQAGVAALRRRLGLHQPFVMYTGGIDHRKNIEGLIRAYASLPESVRSTHQLAIVCAVQPADVERLNAAARRAGLGAGRMVFTGYVSDADLVALYNLCAVFVFPSLYEGFGLPVLEAMNCGAAVIGADNSSLPEIIGDRDALFDASDDGAIASALHRALTDGDYRHHLRRNAVGRAKEFSWDISAKRAISALENLHGRWQRRVHPAIAINRPTLAYVTPLPPERSGIADYSVELLVGLTRHYEVDVIVDQPVVSPARVAAHCGVRDVAWFEANAQRYDRILYEFGNSHFHQHMFRLLERHPGAVSLHDFYLGGALLHMERSQVEHCWSRAVYASHGYPALVQRFADPSNAVIKYPASLPVVENALGIITNSRFAQLLAQNWYGPAAAKGWAVIPQVRCLEPQTDRADARKQVGIDPNEFVVCSFGILAPTKLNHRLLDAWRSSQLGRDQQCRLVFVGDHYGSEYGQALLRSIESSPLPRNIRITGFTPAGEYRLWLAAADVAVQLRSQSRGETSRGALDCLSSGLPTIVNAHGSMPELPASRVLPDAFADGDLAAALEELRNDPASRSELGRRARAAIADRHNPRTVAEQVARAVEGFYQRAQMGRLGLMASVARMPEMQAEEGDWLELAGAIAETLPTLPRPRQLLVDVSEFAAGGGGNAVSPALRDLMTEPPGILRIEPVRHQSGTKLHYARRFALGVLQLPLDALEDEPVEAGAGDVYLDLSPLIRRGHEHDAAISRLRSRGVRVYAFLHDSMPALQHVPGQLDLMALRYHGVVCASPSLAHRVLAQVAQIAVPRARAFTVAFLESSAAPAAGFPQHDSSCVPCDAWRQMLTVLSDQAHPNWKRASQRSRRAPVAPLAGEQVA